MNESEAQALIAALAMVLAQLIRQDEGLGQESLPVGVRARVRALLARARVAASAPPELSDLIDYAEASILGLADRPPDPP